MATDQKMCSSCHKTLPAIEFEKSYKDGLRAEFNRCFKCRCKAMQMKDSERIQKKLQKISILEKEIKEIKGKPAGGTGGQATPDPNRPVFPNMPSR